MRKVYRHPGSETLAFWWLISAAGLYGLAAVGRPAPARLYIYPAALVGMSWGVICMAHLGQYKRRRPGRSRVMVGGPGAIVAPQLASDAP